MLIGSALQASVVRADEYPPGWGFSECRISRSARLRAGGDEAVRSPGASHLYATAGLGLAGSVAGGKLQPDQGGALVAVRGAVFAAPLVWRHVTPGARQE